MQASEVSCRNHSDNARCVLAATPHDLAGAFPGVQRYTAAEVGAARRHPLRPGRQAVSHMRPRNEVVDLDSTVGRCSRRVPGASWLDSDGAVWCAQKIDRLLVYSRNPRPKPTKCRSSDFGLEAQCGVRLLTQPSSLLRRGPRILCPIALLA